MNNFSSFTFDSLGRNTKIVETTSGSTTSTIQFVWEGDVRSETRDASSALVNLLFANGQTSSGSAYYYTLDHLGSIRELSNSSGTIQTQNQYSPTGEVGKLIESVVPVFQFAHLIFHPRSGLNLTLSRSYQSRFSRFINRDPIEETGGVNLFSYARNNPINITDPTGMDSVTAGGHVEDPGNINCFGMAFGTGTEVSPGPGQSYKDFVESLGFKCTPMNIWGTCTCNDPKNPYPVILTLTPRGAGGGDPYTAPSGNLGFGQHAFLDTPRGFVETTYVKGGCRPIREDWIPHLNRLNWYCCCGCRPPNKGK